MKRIFILVIMAIIIFALSACQLITPMTTFTSVATTSSQSATTSFVSTTQQASTTTNGLVTTTGSLTSSTSYSTTSATTSISTTLTNLVVPIIPTGYSTLQDEMEVVGIPAIGEQTVLVFAVDFSDYPQSTSGISLAQIDLAFNGSSDDLAYESVNSYYWKSSYGKLNLSADIYGFYRADYPSTYYADEYDKLYAWDYVNDDYLYTEDEVTYPDSDLIYELLLYYDDVIDYSHYDENHDGYIDGIYVIYTTPVTYEENEGSDLWWAYQDIYIWEGDVFDGVEPYFFVWSGSDFFFENDEPLNARTVIHETGHMLGLDDYYDYDPDGSYNSGGLGLADMMDNTAGDHNPFSKILLDWVTPMVATESMSIEIEPFMTSGDVIMVKKHWTYTIFTEYFLVSYYTPSDLNDDDPDSLFTIPGVVIYHVSARIDNGYDYDAAYYSIFNNNNSDTYNKLIKFIEADMGGEIDEYGYAENSDLFMQGDVFNLNVYPNYLWYDLTALGFTIGVQSISPESATIVITFS